MANGSVGMNGTSSSSTLDGRWVNTMGLIRPNRRARRTATRYEPADSTPVQKKIVPAVATDRSKRWNSHNASRDWTTKPPPSESSAKSADSVYTMRRDSTSGARFGCGSPSDGDSRLYRTMAISPSIPYSTNMPWSAWLRETKPRAKQIRNAGEQGAGRGDQRPDQAVTREQRRA